MISSKIITRVKYIVRGGSGIVGQTLLKYWTESCVNGRGEAGEDGAGVNDEAGMVDLAEVKAREYITIDGDASDVETVMW